MNDFATTSADNFLVGQDQIAPLFWPSLRPSHVSAWHGHVSFAHWLVTALKPRVIVELGTHNGVSFAAFCNAVQKSGLPTKCYAVDTWQGDEHAGSYGENVYEDLKGFVDERFAGTATMMRCLFDDALPQFAAGSVDLLHIDGLHTLEAVQHDFDTWLPKMSPHGIILFHDTDVRHGDFGVWRLWAELSGRYPTFKFAHAFGLGVLSVGGQPPEALASLFGVRGDRAAENIRHVFTEASANAQALGMVRWDSETRQRLDAIAAGRRNIALNRLTLQSSAQPDEPLALGGAVNGARTGRYGFHTAYENEPWWMVDLGSVQPLGEAVVYNRLDNQCAPRSRTLRLAVSANGADWTTVYSHGGVPFGGMDGRPLRVPLGGAPARFVRVSLAGHAFLHLDQVEVYGPLT